jgi:hypothetical protein
MFFERKILVIGFANVIGWVITVFPLSQNLQKCIVAAFPDPY